MCIRDRGGRVALVSAFRPLFCTCARLSAPSACFAGRGCVGAYGLWLYPPIIPDPPIPYPPIPDPPIPYSSMSYPPIPDPPIPYSSMSYPPIPDPPIPYSSMSQFQELAADPSSDPPDPPYCSIRFSIVSDQA